jgi:hypothetical protein
MGLDMFASLSVRTELDVDNFSLFICEMACVDLELVLHLRHPSLKVRVLSISEPWGVRYLGRFGSCLESKLGCGLSGC